MPKPTPGTHPNADAFPPGVGGPVLRALANAGIRSLTGLTRWRERDFAALHGVGPKGVRILKEAMAKQGLAFRPESQG
jgi:hypothetical protein